MSKQKPKARIKRQKSVEPQKLNLELKEIIPLTDNQQKTFDEYDRGQHLVLHGHAGTGKSYISLYLALEDLLDEKPKYDKIILIRSVVPSRDMGFLPGTIKEKCEVFEEAYKQICNELFGRGDAYDMLKTKGLLEFDTTSFLRGLTFRNSIVIVDESSNLNYQELHTVLTRMGENTRFIVCGDFRQSDFKSDSERNSIKHIMNILDKIPSVSRIEFEKVDVVRSGFVKDFIIASSDYDKDSY